jgi:hypothetical protein
LSSFIGGFHLLTGGEGIKGRRCPAPASALCTRMAIWPSGRISTDFGGGAGDAAVLAAHTHRPVAAAGDVLDEHGYTIEFLAGIYASFRPNLDAKVRAAVEEAFMKADSVTGVSTPGEQRSAGSSDAGPRKGVGKGMFP